MWALKKHLGYGQGFEVAMPLYTVGLDTIEDPIKPGGYPLFARPCPLTPRHGFVDSREVKDWEELQKVIEETKTADPNGEVMLLKYIPSKYNSVWVPTLFTVGKGNDGATAGKDTLTFPLCGAVDERVIEALPEANIGPGQDPYIEAVYTDEGAIAVTQLRSGPKLVGSKPDYLPADTLVEKVILADLKMSLLEWEALIQSYEGQSGVVVYHPQGSPTDHISVHARTFHIPVCVTFKPEVGTIVEKQPTTPPDAQQILKGLVVGDRFILHHHSNGYYGDDPSVKAKTDGSQAVNFLLHTLHHSSAMTGDDSWWLGVGVAFMLRYGTIALRGEARHIKHPMPARDTIYARSIPFPLQRQRASTPALINILRYGNFNGSVGGIKWAQCGNATAKLFDAVGKLAKDPTEESANNLIRAFNFAVNQAHNGGWWLNKFIPGGAFDHVKAARLGPILQLAPMLMRVKEEYGKVTEADITKRINLWSKWQPVDLTPPNLLKANIVTVPGLAGLAVQVQDKLLKTHHKPLVISIPTLMEKLPSLIKGKLYVETTPDGLQIILQPPHEDQIILWKEDKIGA